jgi:hypothetical protein
MDDKKDTGFADVQFGVMSENKGATLSIGMENGKIIPQKNKRAMEFLTVHTLLRNINASFFTRPDQVFIFVVVPLNPIQCGCGTKILSQWARARLDLRMGPKLIWILGNAASNHQGVLLL